jgi:hypothetical protein
MKIVKNAQIYVYVNFEKNTIFIPAQLQYFAFTCFLFFEML